MYSGTVGTKFQFHNTTEKTKLIKWWYFSRCLPQQKYNTINLNLFNTKACFVNHVMAMITIRDQEGLGFKTLFFSIF